MTSPRERQAWYSHGPGEAVDALHNFPERLRRACFRGLTDGVCCKSGLLVKLGEGLECANIGLRRRTRHGHPQHGAAAKGPRGAAVSPTQQELEGAKGRRGRGHLARQTQRTSASSRLHSVVTALAVPADIPAAPTRDSRGSGLRDRSRAQRDAILGSRTWGAPRSRHPRQGRPRWRL